MSRSGAPMTPSRIRQWSGQRQPQGWMGQALHWLHAGPPLSLGAPGPKAGGHEQQPRWRWPELGTKWVLLKADVTKAHRRVKVLQTDWRRPGGFSGERRVGEQGGRVRHGECPILLAAISSSSAQVPLLTLPLLGVRFRRFLTTWLRLGRPQIFESRFRERFSGQQSVWTSLSQPKKALVPRGSTRALCVRRR